MDVNLSSDLELRIECKNLPSLDTFSKSDPYVIAYLYDEISRTYNMVGRTEAITDNNNPKFMKRIPIQYFFEQIQHIKLEVWDSDSTAGHNDDFVGEVECDIGEIVSSRGSVLALPILFSAKHNPQVLSREFSRQSSLRSVQSKLNINDIKQRGQVIIHGDIVKNKNVYLNFNPSGVNLDKKDLFGKSDGFLQFYRVRSERINDLNNNNGYYDETALIKTYETEVVRDTLNPVWKPVRVPLSTLSNGDVRTPMIIKCFDWNRNGKHDYIGEFKTDLTELVGDQLAALSNSTDNTQFPPISRTFTLFKPLRPKKTKPHGQIIFSNMRLERLFSFLDYIQGGMNVNLMVAVDFTGSNGHPDDHQSLHYRGGQTPNSYQQAIKTIGSIVAPYDHNQMFPIWGFGANINGTVHHCFSLSPTNEVHGVEGLLAAYDNTCRSVTLSGPTYFSNVLRTAAGIAHASFSPQSQSYHILLIITDGVINDVDATIEAIVDASDTPLSVIIIGVGNADFSAMNVLDGDDGLLRARSGKVAKRDIVQFVAFNQFKNSHYSLLAKETLAELPQQVVEFGRLHGLKPLVPILDGTIPAPRALPTGQMAAVPVSQVPPQYGQLQPQQGYPLQPNQPPQYGQVAQQPNQPPQYGQATYGTAPTYNQPPQYTNGPPSY